MLRGERIAKPAEWDTHMAGFLFAPAEENLEGSHANKNGGSLHVSVGCGCLHG
jgi:hypothetical protein